MRCCTTCAAGSAVAVASRKHRFGVRRGIAALVLFFGMSDPKQSGLAGREKEKPKRRCLAALHSGTEKTKAAMPRRTPNGEPNSAAVGLPGPIIAVFDKAGL